MRASTAGAVGHPIGMVITFVTNFYVVFGDFKYTNLIFDRNLVILHPAQVQTSRPADFLDSPRRCRGWTILTMTCQ